MEIISALDPSVPARAASVLAAGGIILYPTDTLYGLGADALSDEAVDNIYAIKGRDEKKPMHCIVADMTMADEYGEVNELATALAEKFLPGPLTMILKKRGGIDTGIARGMDTIGVRIPRNEFCTTLVREFGLPFTTTSANKSGMMPACSTEAILLQLGESVQHIDLVIDAGVLPSRSPSTVVDVSSHAVVILREGALSTQEILAALPSQPIPRGL